MCVCVCLGQKQNFSFLGTIAVLLSRSIPLLGCKQAASSFPPPKADVAPTKSLCPPPTKDEDIYK